jgi:hypothetical protein
MGQFYGNGGSCSIDGAPGSCSITAGLVAGGAGFPCLNNDCSGYGTTRKVSDTGTDYMFLVFKHIRRDN